MMRHSRSLHEVLRCGLLALALTLSLSLAAAERPLRVPSASGLRPLAEWSTLQDTVTARALFTPQEPAVAPVEWQPVQDGGGYVVLPVNFRGTTHERASWDLPVQADLSQAKAIAFDFFCPNPELIRYFAIYFHSVNGWYAADFGIEHRDDWNRIVIRKDETRMEESAAGWGHIDTIRISGWRLRSDADSWMAIANLGAIVEDAQVLVARADSCAAKGGPEAKAYGTYASTMMRTLERAGIPAVMMADREISAADLAAKRVLVLPYNGSLPESLAQALPAFVERGGKLIACYSGDDSLLKLIGLRRAEPGWTKAPGGLFRGFAATAQRLPLQPGFAEQASQFSGLVEPIGQGRVIAVWRTADGADSRLPAITLTDRGAFIGHIWRTDGGKDKVRLLQALFAEFVAIDFETPLRTRLERVWSRGDLRTEVALRAAVADSGNAEAQAALARAAALVPQVAAKLQASAWQEAETLLEQAERAVSEAFFRLQRPKRGEFRGVWCHSAFGVKGRGWEASVRQLAEQGFTAVFPNMCWGGVAFYPSEVLPPYAGLKEQGDQVRQCLDACLRYGVECHVWKVCWNMGSQTSKEHVQAMVKAGRTQVERSGKPRERWLCPSHPLNRQLEIDAMVELAVRYPQLAGVHFDYIRYPGGNSCFCDGCRGRFEQTLGRTLAAWPPDERDETLLKAWRQFRRDQIDAVVRGVRERLDSLGLKTKVSAAVFSNWPTDRVGIAQDWKRWCDQGWLDFACPMDYTPHLDNFRALVLTQKDWVPADRLCPGIGMSCWTDPTDAVRLLQQIKATRTAGVRGFMIFDYDTYAYSNLTWLGLGCTRRD